MTTSLVWTEVKSLPLKLKTGLLIFGVGSGLDMIYHVSPAHSLDRYLGVDGVGAHLTIFVGMLVILLAVFAQGLHRGGASPQ